MELKKLRGSASSSLRPAVSEIAHAAVAAVEAEKGKAPVKAEHALCCCDKPTCDAGLSEIWSHHLRSLDLLTGHALAGCLLRAPALGVLLA